MSLKLIVKENPKSDLKAYICNNEPSKDIFKCAADEVTGEPEKYMAEILTENKKTLIVKLQESPNVSSGHIMLTREQMGVLGVDAGKPVFLDVFGDNFNGLIVTEVAFKAYNPQYDTTRCARDVELKPKIFFDTSFLKSLKEMVVGQVLNKKQKLVFEHKKEKIILIVNDIRVESSYLTHGIVNNATKISVAKVRQNESFPPDFNSKDLVVELKKMGIGGMAALFTGLVKKLYKARCMPEIVKKKLGVSHGKGVLFHGPPGTGKTLIARNFSRLILCVTPEVINGPEMKAKYMGDSEKNIRELFQPAIVDYKKYGTSSPLHVLIFDEFDSIAENRSIDKESKTHMVAQLLTLLDGVNALPNILILATTNLKELIDPALLRKGRIHLQVYVGFPSYEERREILDLKLMEYRDAGLARPDIDLDNLANKTEGMSGADLDALVTSALINALDNVDFDDIIRWDAIIQGKIKLSNLHFQEALEEEMTEEMTD